MKIDGEFIRNLAESRVNQLVVQSVVDIARGLGKRTIAEFVGDEESFELLKALRRRLRPGLLHRQAAAARDARPETPAGNARRVTAPTCYHVELREALNVAHAFNLSPVQLRDGILRHWLSRSTFQLEDRKWSPEKAKLVIYEAPELEIAQLGLGRGWGEVTRSGRDVTEQMLQEAQAPAATPADEATEWLKTEIVDRSGTAPLSLHDVVGLAHMRYRGWRASDRLAVAERAVWELLHLGSVRLVLGDVPVDPSGWEAVVLDWDVWTGTAPIAPRLELPSG